MAEATPALEIRNLHKRYGQLEVLKGISLTARDGDVISILGSSGSGKSTFLRCINLLENPHQGQILVAGEELKLKAAKSGELVAADGKQINRLRSEIGFVFQNYALFPQLSVSENIAFGLDVKKIDSNLKKTRVQELLKLMQLEKFGDCYPNQLSGGQRQRVALARALAVEPKVLLLDEPFAALDAKIRKQLRSWLRELHHQISVTTVFVTHDHSEAMELAQEIVILEKGKILQIGSAQELSDHPTNSFVENFLELEKVQELT